jgi:hypothetical protein
LSTCTPRQITHGKSLQHQRDFRGVTARLGLLERGMSILTEERRIDVAAAGEQQRRDAVQQRRR